MNASPWADKSLEVEQEPAHTFYPKWLKSIVGFSFIRIVGSVPEGGSEMVRQLLDAGFTARLPATAREVPSRREELLRRKRSKRYIDALQRLDSGGALADPEAQGALREAIEAEFPQAEAAPLGWVAKCYLGVPYEVHTLDPLGAIAQHYRWGEALPARLERARALARSGRYLVIEVHSDKLIAVAEDGATSVCAA